MNSVVIVAGGSGQRMGSSIPKQFLKLAGVDILTHTVNRFRSFLPDYSIIIVLAKEYFDHEIIRKLSSNVTLVEGGKTRFESVKNGIIAAKESEIVLVHDAVRPFFSKRMIFELIEKANSNGGAIPVVPVVDSLRYDSLDGNGFKAVNRDLYKAVQTPQVFKTDLLLKAFNQPYDDKFTDEATVWEQAGGKIDLVVGETYNIKITTPMDLIFAEGILNHLKD